MDPTKRVGATLSIHQCLIESITTQLLDEHDEHSNQVEAVLHNFSDLKSSVEELQKLHHKYLEYLLKGPIPWCVADSLGFYREANERMLNFLGYSHAELTKLSFKDVTHEADLATGLKYFEQIKKGTLDEVSLIKRYLNSDGQPKWSQVSAVVHRAKSGRIKFMTGCLVPLIQPSDTSSDLVLTGQRCAPE